MAKQFGLGNYILSEVVSRLMLNPQFSKFVYYKDVDSEDILSLPNLDNPVGELYKNQVWKHRRPQKVLHEQDINVFVSLGRIRPQRNKGIHSMEINISVLVHDGCMITANGNRDICIMSTIIDEMVNEKFYKSIGNCELIDTLPLYGLQTEHSGYELRFKVDGFSNECLNGYSEDK